MNGRTHRIVVLFGLAVACAVALAGGAQAATQPDDRGGLIGVGATQADVDLACRARACRSCVTQHPLPCRTCSNGRSFAGVATSCAPTTGAACAAPAALRSRRRSPRQSILPWLERCAVRRGRRARPRPAWRRGAGGGACPAAPPDRSSSSVHGRVCERGAPCTAYALKSPSRSTRFSLTRPLRTVEQGAPRSVHGTTVLDAAMAQTEPGSEHMTPQTKRLQFRRRRPISIRSGVRRWLRSAPGWRGGAPRWAPPPGRSLWAGSPRNCSTSPHGHTFCSAAATRLSRSGSRSSAHNASASWSMRCEPVATHRCGSAPSRCSPSAESRLP